MKVVCRLIVWFIYFFLQYFTNRQWLPHGVAKKMEMKIFKILQERQTQTFSSSQIWVRVVLVVFNVQKLSQIGFESFDHKSGF
jgi:hypothetical protein